MRAKDMKESVIGLMVTKASMQERCAVPVAVVQLIMIQMSQQTVKLKENSATLLNTNVLKASFA